MIHIIHSTWSCAAQRLLTVGVILAVIGIADTLSLAAEPPPCSKSGVLAHVKRAYEGMLMLENSTQKFRLEDPRETGYGPAAPGVNQYTPSKDYYNKSRYCEADLKLNNGGSEQAYYRLDGRKDEAEIDYNFSPCFIKHNTRKDDCVDERPGEK